VVSRGCGSGPRRASSSTTYRPASLFVVERVRHTYACSSCSRTADPPDEPTPTIATAPLPAQPIDKGLPGPGLLAHVVVSKFSDHLPLHRQVGILARHGVDISRSTLGGWVAAAANLLKPLVDRMAELVRRSRVIQTDDTPVPVLNPGARRTKTGHLWAYLGDADHPYVVFDFTPTYSGDGPRAWLGNYAGYVQADALKQYDPLFGRAPPCPTEVGCWAHARRYFFDARVSDPERSHDALARIRALYAVEREAKEKQLTRRDLAAYRREYAGPVLAAFADWLAVERPRVLPKSAIGEAATYATNQWSTLGAYLTDGRLTIDNAAAEQAIRPLCVGRRNWLHLGGDGGLKPMAVLLSITASVKRHGLDPWAYLRHLLTELPARAAGADLADLLPDRWARCPAGPVAVPG
jgi:transposase